MHAVTTHPVSRHAPGKSLADPLARSDLAVSCRIPPAPSSSATAVSRETVKKTTTPHAHGSSAPPASRAALGLNAVPVTPPGSYPERKTRAVPPPAELAKVPSSSAYCFGQLCLEIKYNLPYYLRKSDLMRYLRDQHDFWWAKYSALYERDAYTYPTTKSSQGWDYTNAAKEMLSRCKLHDSMFTQVLKLDLCLVADFGTYCKMVFLELNKLKPAFPDSPSSQQVFESSVKDLMKFVLKQAPADFQQDPAELERIARSAGNGADGDEDDED